MKIETIARHGRIHAQAIIYIPGICVMVIGTHHVQKQHFFPNRYSQNQAGHLHDDFAFMYIKVLNILYKCFGLSVSLL